MGERKVLNKYIPADFDPSLIPRGKKLSSKDGTVPVRMMLPFSIQCSTCQTFLYRGRKFNSKKEAMGGASGKYLNIQRWRFYIKCTHCSRPLTFLTDPKNADYEMESGGTRNYEVNKDKVATEEQIEQEKQEEEKEDPMKALENRVLDSQREMADLDNLEQIKAMNLKHLQLLSKRTSSKGTGDDAAFDNNAKAVLDTIEQQKQQQQQQEEQRQKEDLLTEEDEALIQSIQFGRRPKQTQQPYPSDEQQSTITIQRLNEIDEQRLDEKRRKQTAFLEQQLQQQQQKRRQQQQQQKQRNTFNKNSKNNMPVLVIKAKRKKQPEQKKPEQQNNNKKIKTTAKITTTAATSGNNNNNSNNSSTTTSPKGGGLSALLGGYSSASSSEDESD